MSNITSSLSLTLSAQGKFVPLNLLELQTVAGTRLFFADAPCAAPSLLSAFDSGNSGVSAQFVSNDADEDGFSPNLVPISPHGPGATLTTVQFAGKLLTPPSFSYTASLTTATSSAVLANNSGTTVSRDGTALFTKAQLWGALFVWRLWDPAAEYALQTVIGNISDVPSVGDRITLSLRSWLNFSEIKAPDGDITDSNCLNVFGLEACGSKALTPCQNTYGSCTSVNRFKGIVSVWDSTTNNQRTGIAQTIPATSLNLRRPA